MGSSTPGQIVLGCIRKLMEYGPEGVSQFSDQCVPPWFVLQAPVWSFRPALVIDGDLQVYVEINSFDHGICHNRKVYWDNFPTVMDSVSVRLTIAVKKKTP